MRTLIVILLLFLGGCKTVECDCPAPEGELTEAIDSLANIIEDHHNTR